MKEIFNGNYTFSISDSLNVAFDWLTVFRSVAAARNSGDRKSISTLTNWSAGMILKATRPRDVICRLFGVTNGRMRLTDGVSVDEINGRRDQCHESNMNRLGDNIKSGYV